MGAQPWRRKDENVEPAERPKFPRFVGNTEGFSPPCPNASRSPDNRKNQRISGLFLALAREFGDDGGVPRARVEIPDALPKAPPTVVVSMDEALARWRDLLSAEDKSVRTIEVYSDRVKQCAAAAGWLNVSHVDYESAMAFIAARKRNDHKGKAWDNGACRQAMSCLRSFGKFLNSTGLRKPNPLDNISLPKRRVQKHKHPFTEQEARALIAASLARYTGDRRVRGHAPLVWACLFWTGLRHSEVQSPCKANPYGGLKWRDVLIDGEYPGIWTDPKWLGNKRKTRDWLPLHPQLHALLVAHRSEVPHKPDDPVFPNWPVRATWVDDRARARLPAYDDDGRALSVHATRATYSTWLGKLVLPEGLRETLTRHTASITEKVYTTRGRAEMAAAIGQLPNLWPEKVKKNVEGTCTPRPNGYSDVGEPHDHITTQRTRTPPPRGSPLEDGGGALGPLESPAPGSAVHGSSDCIRKSGLEDLSFPLLAGALESMNMLIRALASGGSKRSPDHGRAESEPDRR